ncbi:MAG: dTMP kinase [Verrucomicrobia bacterium]|nr:MAG: dTMP kinase [Verrucomicrobiota bacterium]
MGNSAKRGFLVVVEGVDGAGKSTVLRHLAAHCKDRGRLVISSREPTDGPHGRRLRETAVHGRLPLEAELELFMLDRRAHVAELITPGLQRDAVVLLDRYYFSTAAYQGARGADPEAVLQMNEEFAPVPDLVLLLDCAPSLSLERILTRGGGVDAFEKMEALEAVRNIFLSLNRPCIRVVDASGTPERVAGACVVLVEELLAARLN